MSQHASKHLSTDPIMSKLIARVGPCTLHPRRLPPFESLVHAIIHQQLSGAAAGTILKRFKALYGNSRFPSPKQVVKTNLATLRTAGLSKAKATYIHDLAKRAVNGQLPNLKQCDQMTDQQLIETLTEIKGVGRWTAEMLLIFNLGRPDVLPVHDLGVRRGYQLAYRKRQLPSPEQLDRIGMKWSPYRTTAAWYLWRAADFLKDGEW